MVRVRQKTALKGGEKKMQGYCVKCRQKVTISGGKDVTWKNGRRAHVGKCPTCGTTVARVLGKA